MCHCGVEEYILPITYKEKKIGFVSVSGYRQNADLALQKLFHASDKFQLNFSQMKQLYFEYLNPNIPDQEFVFTLMAPLITMLEYLYVKQQELYQQFDMEAHEESSVFLKALLYMERYYREPVTLSRLCEFCHCSCSYMSHIFKQRTGKNINQYRNELRINEAKTLLRSTSLSVTDIALSLGFSSPNYFFKGIFQPMRLHSHSIQKWSGYCPISFFFFPKNCALFYTSCAVFLKSSYLKYVRIR